MLPRTAQRHYSFSGQNRQKQISLLTSENISSLQRICQLVDGLPLGLELAATWIRMISLKEVANEIEKSMDFLTTTARDIPQRHRSIRAVFDYSWSLLTDEEQSVMQKLSVFRSGFTRKAAETVADSNLQILSTLVGKSLVRHNQSMRYDLHELVRQYAAAHLHANIEQEHAARRQHSNFYLTMLAEV